MADSPYVKSPPDNQALKRRYHTLFSRISAVLLEIDPAGINFGINPDEYEPETGSIIPRLKDCASAADVQRVVHEELIKWFGAESVAQFKKQRELAARIWALWLEDPTS